MSAASAAKAGKSPNARARVSNGSHLGVGDGRSKWARRLRDLIEAYSNDLGGDESLPEMKRSLIRRAATLTIELEQAEAAFAERGEAAPPQLGEYQTVVNSLRRVLETLGLNRPAKDGGIQQQPEVPEDGRAVLMSRIEAMTSRPTMPVLSELAICVGDRQAKYELARRIHHLIVEARRTGQPLPLNIANMAVERALAVHAEEPEAMANPVKEAAEAVAKAEVENPHRGPEGTGTVWDLPANDHEPEPKAEVDIPHATSRTLVSIRAMTAGKVPA